MPTLFPNTLITGELLERLRLPDDAGRLELVDGQLEITSHPHMTPTNRKHAQMTMTIGVLLSRPGWTVLADAGVYVRRDPDTIRFPDVMMISESRDAGNDPERAWLTVAPELAIEIVSPSNEAEQLDRKVREYLAAGVDAVWIVDLDSASVTVHWQVAREPDGGDLWITQCRYDGDDPLRLPDDTRIPVSALFPAPRGAR